jgi:hypothetical protein
MYKKLIPVAIVALMLLVFFYPVQQVDAAPAPVSQLKPMDVGPDIRSWKADESRLDLSGGSSDGGSSAAPLGAPPVTKTWLILNDYTGQYQLAIYYLAGAGTVAEVWVQVNLAYPAGDPRSSPVITQEQVAYLLEEFDTNIYPAEKDYFRAPDAHDGTNAVLDNMLGLPADYYVGDKFVILVSNVRDEAYYDPTYPNYIAGFYSPTYEQYFDRNIITIDSHDWANRIGPGVARPYLYEGIIAHEMQHLIHDDADSDEEAFVNEGLSDFVIPLCGYGGMSSHMSDLIRYPENSLVAWEDQGGREVLADYGIAYMWTLFLYEKFGTTFIKKLFNEQKNGISGINSALQACGTTRCFADLYHDFSVALLIDWSMNNYKYGFKTENLKIDMGTPMAPNPQAYNTPGAPAWGSDYLWLNKNARMAFFDGDDAIIHETPWSVSGGALYSGTGDLVDNWAIFEAEGGGLLTFTSVWDMEDYWDFGFVQVSTDGGLTWTSLPGDYTTNDYDPNAHPDIIANLPGITSFQLTPVKMSYDLSAYAGMDVLLAFRYMTDWGTYFEGWYIWDVYVDGKLITDGSDISMFMDMTELFPIENDFTVTLVAFKNTMFGPTYVIKKIILNDITETGFTTPSQLFYSYDKVAMIVTYDAAEGVTEYAMYNVIYG